MPLCHPSLIRKIKTKRKRTTNTSINVNKHTDPRIEVFCDSSLVRVRALPRGNVSWDPAPKGGGAFRAKIFQLF